MFSLAIAWKETWAQVLCLENWGFLRKWPVFQKRGKHWPSFPHIGGGRSSARKQQKGWKTEKRKKKRKKTPKASFLLHLESKPFQYFQYIFPKCGSCHISPKSPGFAPKARIEEPLVWCKVPSAGSVPGAAVQELERWAHPWLGGAQERRGSPVRRTAQGRRCMGTTRSSGWGAWLGSQVPAEPLSRVVAPLAQPQRCSQTTRAASKAHLFVTGDSSRGPRVHRWHLSPPQHTHSPPNTWPPRPPCSQREHPLLDSKPLKHTPPPFPITTTNPLPAAVPGLTLWDRMGGKPSSDLPSNSHSSRGPCWKMAFTPLTQWRDLPGAPEEGLVSWMVTPGLKV